MNIKYLLIVFFCMFFVFSKNSIAQEEIDIDLMSIDEYSGDEDDYNDDSEDYGDGDDEEDSQVITTQARSSQPDTPIRKIYTDEFKYQWYIQAAGGLQFLMGEDDSKGKFMSRQTFAPSITGGFRWNPNFGVRLNVTGGSLHGFNDGHSGTYRFWKGKSDAFKEDFAKRNNLREGINNIERWDPQWSYKGWTIDHDGGQIHYNTAPGAVGYHWIYGRDEPNVPGWNQLYMQHIRYIAAHAAMTMNLFNVIGGADDSRKFDMSLHLGPTYFHTFPHLGNDAYDGFGINGGLQAQYHINDNFGVFTEFSGVAMPDGFDGHLGGDTFDLVGQALLGVTYKFPTETWTMPKLPPRVATIDDDMNDELNRIRAELMSEMNQMVDLQPEIDRLRSQLAALQVEEVVEEIAPEKESYFYPTPVHFQIGKSDIDSEGWRTIEEVATYLKNNPEASVIVTGYADKGTGTASINERLSRDRSIRVADALHDRYNIPRSRIATDWRGDNVQPFFRNQMNRAVLFYIEFDNKN